MIELRQREMDRVVRITVVWKARRAGILLSYARGKAACQSTSLAAYPYEDREFLRRGGGDKRGP